MMDFEGSPSSGVVEYGLVSLRDGEIRSIETALCRPVGHIPEKDRAVHGIEDSSVRSRAPFSDYYEKFVELRRKGVFAAHNRFAENTFIKNVWALPPTVPDWREGASSAQEWGPWIDTLSIYKAIYPGLESYALGALVDRFQVREQLETLAEAHCPESRRKPHCALYDALASALLLLRLEWVDELAGRITTGWLLELSEGRKQQQELF